MKYGKIIHGKFHKRLNQFVAEVYINGLKELVHVKNTGRLKELLQPNHDVILEVSSNPNRKTKFSLIGTYKHKKIVNIDSQAPNHVAYEAIKNNKMKEFSYLKTIKREVSFGNSRFDLYYENKQEKGFIEVKGVTLEKNKIAMFPDAPTSRGTKHVLELIKAVNEGYTGTILFVIQMKGCHGFTPNKEMDKAFMNALMQASKQGVRILAYDTIVKKDELILGYPIPVHL